MQEEEHAVGAQADVELDDGGQLLGEVLEGLQAVFGVARQEAPAAMGADQGAALCLRCQEIRQAFGGLGR
ncbi:hypothetical protein RZS08_25005, partial [Arthrospira platensis SPKY1]|nr:hypothetical protein [Arthrospira platensis SPKY1]